MMGGAENVPRANGMKSVVENPAMAMARNATVKYRKNRLRVALLYDTAPPKFGSAV